MVRHLPRGSRVLDLATGDGAVLAKIQRVRPDLRLVGVDSATTLPHRSNRMTIKSNVAMEQLPFADATFDLVTSQFGLEYGDIRKTAAQIARVLRPSGGFGFLVHHAEGPIVAHNSPRRAALESVLDQTDLLSRARALTKGRAISPLPTPSTFRIAVEQARRLFPEQPVGAEFAGAILQTLELGRFGPPKRALDTLDELESRARNDVARIRALMAAARDGAGIAALQGDLATAGLRTGDPELVRESAAAKPFAWLVSGHRQS
jgi:SAM-dependent methyltransferase